MSFYAVLDLEMCRIPKRIRSENKIDFNTELIQIGAVLLDDIYEIVDEFKTFVSPEFGAVDKFIEELTGIKNSDLEKAPGFEEAMGKFLEWLPENAVPVSWSESDKFRILKECEAKKISVPGLDGYIEKWVDCQKTFAKTKENRRGNCGKHSENQRTFKNGNGNGSFRFGKRKHQITIEREVMYMKKHRKIYREH